MTTKKISLQTLLLIAVLAITWFFTVKLNLSDDLFNTGVQFAVLFVVLHLSLFIFLPITAIYFMRRKTSKAMGRIFRGTAYVLLFIFLILGFSSFLFEAQILFYLMTTFGFDEYITIDFTVSLIYFLLAVIIYLTARVNKSLDEKFILFPLHEDKKLRLVVTAILLVLSTSLYIWFNAIRWVNHIDYFREGYENTEMVYTAMRDVYDIAFKKIVLTGGFIFTSTFLLLKVMKDKK
ncbi:hypothetical protein KKA15_04415 [Patescibacteria group bacterium]|nr:hypothetical protein [Patescibacteria group bacterium]